MVGVGQCGLGDTIRAARVLWRCHHGLRAKALGSFYDTLVIGGDDHIIDSVAICQYLADKHKQLTFPAGTIARAHQDSFTMFADGRSCLDLSQQLHAVEKAVGNAKRELIHDHIEHCLDDGDRAHTKTSLKELKELAKYL